MPTTNPVPSTDPTDLLFNAGKLDEVVNGASNSFTDRLGVARRTVAGMNADFDAQLADAESDLNVYRADAAASAAEALGYLHTIRATSYGAYANDPTTDPLGNPPTVGDEYFNTTANLLKRWNGTTWQASDINTANLAASSGSSLVGYDTGTVQDVLDGAKSLQDYAALRAYTGRATRIYITGLLATAKPVGIAGMFQYDSTDSTSADNGGTIIVLNDGRRFKRDYSGEVSVGWFGVSTSASASENTAAIQAAAGYCEATGQFLRGVAGTYSTNGTITLKCSGDLSNMTLNVAGATVTPGVRVGKTTGGHTFKINLKLPEVNNANHVVGDGWASYSANTGVSIDNLYDSFVLVPSVIGFGFGVNAGGNADAGLAACEIKLGYIADNKVNLRIGPKSATGWSNANTYHILRCRHNGAETNGGVPFAGTRNILIENCNDNVLIKPTVEGSTAATEFTLEFRNANFNTFIQPRWENSAAFGGSTMPIKMYADSGEGTQGNLILGGYEFGTGLSYTFEGAGVISNNTKLGAGRGEQSFSVQVPIAVQNTVGAGVAQAHFQGFNATAQVLGKSASATDYTYRIYSNGIDGKRSTDENPRVRIDWSSAGILLGTGTTNPLTYGIFAFGTYGIASNCDWMPYTTGTRNLGTASYRWNNCYLVNAPNVSSDERTKQQITELSDAERAVAIKCKGLIRKYKLNASVEEKGSGARWHFGAIAQEIVAAFESEGLDAFSYSLLCHDVWAEHPEETDDAGNVVTPYRAAGGMYSLRYEELLAFIIAAL